MKGEKIDRILIKHRVIVLLLVMVLTVVYIFATSHSERRSMDNLNIKDIDDSEIVCDCPELEVPICGTYDTLASKAYVIERCNLTCYEPVCLINESLIFEKVKNFNYENKSPVSANLIDAKLAELLGLGIEAKFLVARGAGDWNTHYCPVSLKDNASAVGIETYNRCFIEYAGETLSEVSENNVVLAALERLGFSLTYDGFEWKPIDSQRDAYNSKRSEILNSSKFVLTPLKVIDVKYETLQSGLGCSIYEAHLFLDQDFNLITGDKTYEICVD